MRRLVYHLLVSLAIVSLSLGADYFFLGDEPFGVWAFTLAAGLGMLGALVGILIVLSSTLVRAGHRWHRTIIGANVILTGALTFILAWLLWLLIGQPSPLDTIRSYRQYHLILILMRQSTV